MENEIKVGEYCRTSNGKIFKCSEIVLGYIPKDENKTMIIQNIVKHSPNLIDIIEVGDYVNGEKVTEIKEWNSSKDGYYRYTVTCHYEIIRADEIETIVTKEQFESISYKVTKM